jgi:hypothetical protein
MNNNVFSGWSIDKAVYDWMTKHLPEGKTILELGSGNSTQILATRWNVISVEENKDWVNKYHNNYIHAPIKNDYYDIDILKEKLPKKYDLMLVDGPAYGNRNNMLNNLELFELETSGCSIFIFDDVERVNDLETYKQFLKHVSTQYKISETNIITSVKSFAYILLERNLVDNSSL